MLLSFLILCLSYTVVADNLPFDLCVQVIDNQNNQPISNATCLFTDQYLIQDANSMFYTVDGIYCANINLSYPIGTMSYNVSCTYGANTQELLSSVDITATSCDVSFTQVPLEFCQIDNTQRFTYESSNSSCQASYNTTESCNYCSENIFQTATDCSVNGSQTVSYEDQNYVNCCGLTGLASDCHILNYPYNSVTNQSCDYLQKDFTCNVDENPVLNDKMNVVCEMPDSEEYCCVTNIYQNNNLLATTPEYKDVSNSIINLNSQAETRTCFTPQSRLLNAYYTQKELRPSTDYVLQIKCANNETTLISNYAIAPEYGIPDWGIHRIQWVGQNPALIIVSFVVLLLIVFAGVFVINKARGR
jgi:hypothetical protein